jgi:hypothetical protein
LAELGPLSDREVWIVAGEIMSSHGDKTFEYIFERLSDVLEDTIAVEDWRRIAAAVDEITAGKPRC